MSTSVGARLPDWRDALLVVAAAVAVNLIGAVGVPFTATESAWFAGLDLPAYLPAAELGVRRRLADSVRADRRRSRTRLPRRPRGARGTR